MLHNRLRCKDTPSPNKYKHTIKKNTDETIHQTLTDKILSFCLKGIFIGLIICAVDVIVSPKHSVSDIDLKNIKIPPPYNDDDDKY